MLEGSPRILIVRPSALGDVARTVPILVSLRKAYPQAHIDWLVNEPFADVIRHHPALNHIIPFDRKRLARIGLSWRATREGLNLARTLRQKKYDLVIDCQGLFRSGLLTWLTRAPQRVGLANAREGASLAYTDKVAVPVSKVHTVDGTLQLIESLGHEPIADMQLFISAEDQRWLKNFEREHNLTDRGYAIVAPTAKWGCKCWPIEHYTTLARRLLTECLAGDHVIALASPAEHAQLEMMKDNLQKNRRDGDAPVADRFIAPTTTVGQMMALISKCNLLVANDSAPLHIAVGFNRPLVAIFGPTDPAVVGPYHRDDTVLQPPNLDPTALANYRRHLDDDTLIRGIKMETVWDKVVEQLNKKAEG